MFCIKCGNKAKIGLLCEECFLKENRLIKLNNLSILLCPVCSSYYDKGKWVETGNIERIVKNKIEEKICSREIKKIGIQLKRIGNRYMVRIACIGFIPPCDRVKKEEKIIYVKIKKQMCSRCIKLSGGYYEAVLQIRGNGKERILEMIKKLIKNAIMEEKKNGYDIRFIKKAEAAKIARMLKLKGFEIKESYRFVSTKKDKRLYRNYYSIRWKNIGGNCGK